MRITAADMCRIYLRSLCSEPIAHAFRLMCLYGEIDADEYIEFTKITKYWEVDFTRCCVYDTETGEKVILK